MKKKRQKTTDMINRQKTLRKKPRLCSTNVRSVDVKEKKIDTTKKMILLPVYVVDEKEEISE